MYIKHVSRRTEDNLLSLSVHAYDSTSKGMYTLDHSGIKTAYVLALPQTHSVDVEPTCIAGI